MQKLDVRGPNKTKLALALGAVGVLALSIFVGVGDLGDASLRGTFISLRIGRTLAAVIAGAALSTAGVLVQGIFRNPLAEPSVLGTTAGAVLGGKVVLFMLEVSLGALAPMLAPELLVPLGCIVGALVALGILLVLDRRGDDVLYLLLAGMGLSSLFIALGSLLIAIAQTRWELGRALVSFSLGSLSGVGTIQVLAAAPLVIVGVLAAASWSKTLDVLLTGDDEARTLGVDVHATRRFVAVWVAVLTGTAVFLGGAIGFVGLVVPHAMRGLFGVRHARLIPASAIAGGVFVVACDVLVRAVETDSEIPLGVVTSLVGAPLFLQLLHRLRKEARHG